MTIEISQEILPLHRMLEENTAAEATGSVTDTGSDTGPADLQQSSDVIQTLIEIGTNILLFLLIFGMAATVDFRNLKRQLKNRYAIITGLGMKTYAAIFHTADDRHKIRHSVLGCHTCFGFWCAFEDALFKLVALFIPKYVSIGKSKEVFKFAGFVHFGVAQNAQSQC
eukprot:CAMPEP_0194125324 /NCGR_PEP_ID=MMETSP0150-20130528/59403_1 /TAXON_ID=122233 /ORGANISM="Chaetoceros debilis, Strain MM31A-1" /LENGTH=167 /DNA_ID=CAMNT_0038819127 /DNA_START=394 /DNA_END=897 /DNA_ORIENTATION=-